MFRMLGFGLVAVLVLVIGPAERAPLTKVEYVALVRAAGKDVDDLRLFEEVVNSDVLHCRVCHPDPGTAYGSAWLRSERRLREQVDEVSSRLGAVRPPAAVVGLHREWISALQSCSARLRLLDIDYRMLHASDVVAAARKRRLLASDYGNMRILQTPDPFEKEVALTVRRDCFDRFREVLPAFQDRGYVFAEG